MNESSQAIYINESGIVVLEIEKDKRIPMMIDTLLDIWKSSVRASHHFSQKTISFALHHKPKMHCVE